MKPSQRYVMFFLCPRDYIVHYYIYSLDNNFFFLLDYIFERAQIYIKKNIALFLFISVPQISQISLRLAYLCDIMFKL